MATTGPVSRAQPPARRLGPETARPRDPGVGTDPVGGPAGTAGPRAGIVGGRFDLPLAGAVGLVVALLAWFRMSAVTRSTIWAEDGPIFLVAALRTPEPWGTVFFPYDGYLHVGPRIIAELVTFWLPPERYAVALTAASCVVVAALCAVVFVLSREVLDALVLRLVVAVVPVLVPSVAREVLGNIANLHWFFLWATPWLLLGRARTRGGAWLLGVLALVTTLTEVQAAYFAPLLLWRLRDTRTWPVKAGYLLGGLGQAIALATTHRAPPASPSPTFHDIVAGYLVNAVMSLWVGSSEAVTSVVARFGFRAAALLALPSAVALVVALARGRTVQRVAVLAFTLASGVVWVGTFVVNHPGYVYPQPGPDGQPELVVLRYAAVPAMFLLAALLVAVSTLPWRWWSAAVTAGLGVPLVVASVLNFVPADATRAGGPVWLQQVAAARQLCLTTGAAEEPMQVAPILTATVPCDVLTGSG